MISRRQLLKIGAILGVSTIAVSYLIRGDDADGIHHKEVKNRSSYDVLIIGGSHAGLSAAMALGRMRRTALICDNSDARNKISSHANNLAGQDGMNPEEIRARARKDLEKYRTIQFINATVESVEIVNNKFRAKLSSGNIIEVRKVILAYGVKDKLPKLPGFKELWGKSIIHCPYCHGYEVSNKRIGVINNGKSLEHLLPLIWGLSKDLIVFTNGPSLTSKDFRAQIQRKNIEIVEQEITGLTYEGQTLRSVELVGRDSIPRDVLFVSSLSHPVELKSGIGEALGCEKDERGYYKVLEKGKTTVPGVFAAGDILGTHQSIIGALASGQTAGSGAAYELLHEDFQD